jgi:hypothetical protein
VSSAVLSPTHASRTATLGYTRSTHLPIDRRKRSTASRGRASGSSAFDRGRTRPGARRTASAMSCVDLRVSRLHPHVRPMLTPVARLPPRARGLTRPRREMAAAAAS